MVVFILPVILAKAHPDTDSTPKHFHASVRIYFNLFLGRRSSIDTVSTVYPRKSSLGVGSSITFSSLRMNPRFQRMCIRALV